MRSWRECELATEEQFDWITKRLDALTIEIPQLTPSELVELTRYIGPGQGPAPGPYRFSKTPYLREIVDCFDVNDPTREIILKKGAQLGATVALENIIMYFMVQVKSAPVMLLTADDDLAKIRMDGFVMPMITDSELGHLIMSQDTANTRKTGATRSKVSWFGGGSLTPTGAVNPNKSRSLPIRVLLRDEIDAYKDSVGKDGCPLAISIKRTSSFKQSYKVFDLSTPLIKGHSKISQRFLLGDQRYYFVRCLKCEFEQVMRWRTQTEDGRQAGVVWDMDDGRLVPESARWLCKNCLHPHSNHDKIKLLAPEYGAQWKPTAKPRHPDTRSYHLSGLYCPPDFNSLDQMVLEWLEAWDQERNRPRDNGKAQAFYNTILGEEWELVGGKLDFKEVSKHRRRGIYDEGEIPNKWAQQYCGSRVLFLVCTVDVHEWNLAVSVWGWCRGNRVLLIEQFLLKTEESTARVDDPDSWGSLRSYLEEREFIADDGCMYRPAVTLVDSGYRTEVVKAFCDQFETGVFPIKGRKTQMQNSMREFGKTQDESGRDVYHITVDYYKDRWQAALKKSWPGDREQPETFFNAPANLDDKVLDQLTVEIRQAPIKGEPGSLPMWVRPPGADNTLWDLLVYANAAHDILCVHVQMDKMEMEQVNHELFWDFCENSDDRFFLYPHEQEGYVPPVEVTTTDSNE